MGQKDDVQSWLNKITPNVICDDCLASQLNFKSRQNANRLTRELANESIIKKHKSRCNYCHTDKLCSFHSCDHFIEKTVSISQQEPPQKLANINHLLEIGFETAGQWFQDGSKLNYIFEKHRNIKPALYAFVKNDSVLYVGKTKRQLFKRMNDYRAGNKGQRTSHRLHKLIYKLIQDGESVKIYALNSNSPLKYGKFELNISAGLEDSIIEDLNPEWNIL